MFNMLASIAEFETDLRSERQAEGIAKARENGVKFGRPNKVTDAIKTEIYSRRISGATIGQLAKEFSLMRPQFTGQSIPLRTWSKSWQRKAVLVSVEGTSPFALDAWENALCAEG